MRMFPINTATLFMKLKNTTSDIKLRWFQVRIIHNILTTNKSTAKFIHDQSDQCEFCQTEPESIEHLLWECPITRQFWNNLAELVNKRCTHAHNIYFHKELVLLGLSNNIKTDKVLDQIILIVKFHIYKSKVIKIEPSINRFRNELFSIYNAEKHIHLDSQIFKANWHPYLDLFRSLIRL